MKHTLDSRAKNVSSTSPLSAGSKLARVCARGPHGPAARSCRQNVNNSLTETCHCQSRSMAKLFRGPLLCAPAESGPSRRGLAVSWRVMTIGPFQAGPSPAATGRRRRSSDGALRSQLFQLIDSRAPRPLVRRGTGQQRHWPNNATFYGPSDFCSSAGPLSSFVLCVSR